MIQIFSALGLGNFDFSLIILVGTLLTSCQYIGLKISLPPPPPHFQIPGYVTVPCPCLASKILEASIISGKFMSTDWILEQGNNVECTALWDLG